MVKCAERSGKVRQGTPMRFILGDAMSEAARKLKLSAILTLLLAWAPLATTARQQTNAVLPPATITNIEKAVTAFMARVNAPGLSLAIGVEGQLRFDDGYGLADLENFVPAKASTVYRLASLSKPITAVATMQLVERHRLALEDTVGKWLPDMPAALRPITVRQLLSHQSGIRHYTADEDDTHEALSSTLRVPARGAHHFQGRPSRACPRCQDDVQHIRVHVVGRHHRGSIRPEVRRLRH